MLDNEELIGTPPRRLFRLREEKMLLRSLCSIYTQANLDPMANATEALFFDFDGTPTETS